MALETGLKNYITSINGIDSDFDEFSSHCIAHLGFTHDFVNVCRSEKTDRTKKLECLSLLAGDLIGLKEDIKELTSKAKLRFEAFEKHFEELSKTAPAAFKQLNENIIETDGEAEDDVVIVAESPFSVESSTTGPDDEPSQNDSVHNFRFEAIGRTTEGVMIAMSSVNTKKATGNENFTASDGLQPDLAVMKRPAIRLLVKCLKYMISFVLHNWFFLLLLGKPPFRATCSLK